MNSKSETFQEFLDRKQYNRQSVFRYEWIFGKTFLSTGGLGLSQKYVYLLNLKKKQKVLDVGCGLGGHTFHMAEKYDVDVLGVDLSINMMTIAKEYLSEKTHLKNKVKLEICDITRTNYDEESFDAIYSRDALLHIQNKDELFSNFLKWLKPGGKIFFTDYSRSEKGSSQNFEEYIIDRGYHLLTRTHYKELLEKCGFVNIKSEDATHEFLDTLYFELDKLQSNKDQFLKKFTEEDYKYLQETWTSKIKRVKDGYQKWTSCYAEKPQ